MAKTKEKKGKVEYYTKSTKWEEQGIVQLANYIVGLNLCPNGRANFFKQDIRLDKTGESPSVVDIQYTLNNKQGITLRIAWHSNFSSFGTSIEHPNYCSPSKSGRKVLYAKTYQGILKRVQDCLLIAVRAAEEEGARIQKLEEQKKRRDEIAGKKIALLGDVPFKDVDHYDFNKKQYVFNNDNPNRIYITIDVKNETDTYWIDFKGHYTVEETTQLIALLRNSREYVVQMLLAGDKNQKK